MTSNSIVEKALYHLNNQLLALDKTVLIHWIPSHCGIFGNERADEVAKAGLLLNDSLWTYPSVSYSNQLIRQSTRDKFNQDWSQRSSSAYYYQFYPSINSQLSTIHKNLPFLF